MQVSLLMKPSQALFIFKGISGIHPAGPEGMPGGDAKGYQYGHEGRDNKQVPLHIDVFAEIIKPAAGYQKCQGPAN